VEYEVIGSGKAETGVPRETRAWQVAREIAPRTGRVPLCKFNGRNDNIIGSQMSLCRFYTLFHHCTRVSTFAPPFDQGEEESDCSGPHTKIWPFDCRSRKW